MSFKDFYNSDITSSSSVKLLQTLLGGGREVEVGSVSETDKDVEFHQNVWKPEPNPAGAGTAHRLDRRLIESLKGAAGENEFTVYNENGALATVPYGICGEVRYSTRTGKVSVYKKNSAAILLSGIKW